MLPTGCQLETSTADTFEQKTLSARRRRELDGILYKRAWAELRSSDLGGRQDKGSERPFLLDTQAGHWSRLEPPQGKQRELGKPEEMKFRPRRGNLPESEAKEK